MKKLKLLIVLMMMLLIGACTKDGVIPDQTNQDDNTLKHGHISKVIKVLPVAGDNTQNLLNAFEQAKSEGPNSVVQLVEGVYNINFMEVNDFIGSFIGAGHGKTIIKPVPDLLCGQWSAERGLPILLKFVGGDIKMSDMTFKAEDKVLCAPPEYLWMGLDLYGYVSFVDWVRNYTPKVRFVKACVEDVEFIGGVDGLEGNGSDYNVDIAIWFGHDYVNPLTPPAIIETRSNGSLTVRNCKFEKTMAALDAAGLKHGNIIFTDNICLDLDYPLYLYDLVNTDGMISNNRFSGSRMFNLYIDNSDMTYANGAYPVFVTPNDRSTYKIFSNVFNVLPNTTGMILLDSRRSMYPDENMPDRYFVHKNIINTGDGSIGIVGINLVDALFQENKLSGSGVVGVNLDGDELSGTYAYNDKLIGNRFSGADYLVSDIILGTYTKDCTVIGVSSDETVIDNGTGNKIKTAKHTNDHQHHGWYDFREHNGKFPMRPYRR